MNDLLVFFNLAKSIIKNMSIMSVLDIVVVSYIFYKGYILMKDTRAVQLLKGIVFILVLIPISDLLHLTTLNWILNNTIQIGVTAVIIIFQPEIRRALEHVGRSAFNDTHILENDEVMDKVITEIVTAAENLSSSKTGALMVIQQMTGLGEVISTGTSIDAEVSSALLENIFVVNTPLHDGATVIRNNRIVAAGCFLPLTNDDKLNKTLGTRHRAAIGISENSDALIVIVSEETGKISLAVNGHLTRDYDKNRLKDILIRLIKSNQNKKDTLKEKVRLWKKKSSTNG